MTRSFFAARDKFSQAKIDSMARKFNEAEGKTAADGHFDDYPTYPKHMRKKDGLVLPLKKC